MSINNLGGANLLLRRRTMMSMHGKEMIPASDGKVWLYCAISDISSGTRILNSVASFSSMSIDGGADINPSTTYQFDTVGEHLVRLSLKNPQTINMGSFEQFLRGIAINQRIYFPESIEVIGDQAAIVRSASLDVHLPKSLKEFRGKSNFSSRAIFPDPINLPNLTTWGEGVFNGATISKIVDLGSITNIAISCIRNVSGLTELHLPATLTNLENASIYECRTLKTVYCYASTPPARYGNVFARCPLTAIYVPAGSVEEYKATSAWNTYANIIQAIPDSL